jgi:type I restriction enzyme S subunit
MVVGRATNLGKPTWSDVDFWPLNTTLYAADFRGNGPKWVYHLFETLDLSGFDSGSVQPMLNRNYIAKVQVRVPPTSVQRAIADVLGALDDKIAANAKLAATADDLARTIFAEMQPDGVVVPLSSTARFVNGRNFTKDADGQGRVVARIAELNSGVGGSTVRSSAEAQDDNIARPGDVLFAWSGSLTLRRWFRDEALVNQHIFKVIADHGYPRWLVHQLILDKLDDFKATAADKATTMGHIQRHHLDEPVILPGPSELESNDITMSALWERALGAERESVELADLRDTLLPALMSGRLTVSEAAERAGV